MQLLRSCLFSSVSILRAGSYVAAISQLALKRSPVADT